MHYSAPINQFGFGRLMWTEKAHNVLLDDKGKIQNSVFLVIIGTVLIFALWL